MSRKLTASDRKSLIRLASSLPKGSDERRAILSGLKKALDMDFPGTAFLGEPAASRWVSGARALGRAFGDWWVLKSVYGLPSIAIRNRARDTQWIVFTDTPKAPMASGKAKTPQQAATQAGRIAGDMFVSIRDKVQMYDAFVHMHQKAMSKLVGTAPTDSPE